MLPVTYLMTEHLPTCSQPPASLQPQHGCHGDSSGAASGQRSDLSVAVHIISYLDNLSGYKLHFDTRYRRNRAKDKCQMMTCCLKTHSSAFMQVMTYVQESRVGVHSPCHGACFHTCRTGRGPAPSLLHPDTPSTSSFLLQRHRHSSHR